MQQHVSLTLNSGVLKQVARAMQTAALISLALLKQQTLMDNHDCIVYCFAATEWLLQASWQSVWMLHLGHVRFVTCSCDRFVCQFVYFAYAASNIDSMWLVNCKLHSHASKSHNDSILQLQSHFYKSCSVVQATVNPKEFQTVISRNCSGVS